MTRKYILTGGPGSGKSSILLELEARGEYIIREAAEDVIKRYQAQRIEEPWKLPGFQLEILDLQIRREERMPRGIKRVFIDRGIPDGLAYTKPGSLTYRCIQNEALSCCIPYQYHGVFLIENLGQTQTNRIRREHHVEALEIERKLAKVYQNLGYQVHRIPPASLQQRADRILEYLEHDAMTQPEKETSGGDEREQHTI